MARVTASEYAEKWGRRLTGSTTDIRRGVERVTEAPGQAAAIQSAKMLDGITRAIQDGRWQRAVAGVSLQDWKAATLDKGIGRIASGVDGAMGKQVQMAERLLAAVDSVKGQVDAMPDASLEDRIARMVAFSRGMSEQRIK
tara:strand:+ start:148 stop:570 length:423 start_codon:yes stop_codon:yes gene_type:complete